MSDDYDRNREVIPIDSRVDNNFRIAVTPEQARELKEEAEERGVSRSGMVRKWMYLGRNIEEQVDPRKLFHSEASTTSTSNPLGEFILDELPSNEEDAVDMGEFESQLQQAVLDQFREILYSDEGVVEKTDSREVYIDG